MKIKDYEKIEELSSTDILLVDTPRGTKTVLFADLLNNIKFSDDANTITRRNTWRGKNLGSSVTYDQYTAIADGSFKGLFLGDYWEINNIVWRIVDFDYWYGSGDVSCTSHHVVIMPDSALYEAPMNDTSTTEGGYVGSKMYTTGLNQAKSIINQAFGAEHILNHREYLTTGMSNGLPVNAEFIDSTVELPNEIMIYGAYIFLPSWTGSDVIKRHTIDIVQLAGMRVSKSLITPDRFKYWLRDPASINYYAMVNLTGNSAAANSTSNLGVRPVFGLYGLV